MWALLIRDLILAFRSGGGAVTALLFYLAVVVAMPFAVGPDTNLLATIGGATLWIGALLAGLLGLDRLFQADNEDGSLDQMMIAPIPLPAQVFLKCVTHWLTTGLPLTLIAPGLWPDAGYGFHFHRRLHGNFVCRYAGNFLYRCRWRCG